MNLPTAPGATLPLLDFSDLPRFDAITPDQVAPALDVLLTDANRALSQRRADAVRRVLEEAGVAGSRLRATGKGESTPVADNASAAGRARTRRGAVIVQ